MCGNKSFYNCNGFNNELIIGSNVSTIGSSAFQFCTNIKKCTFKGDKPTKIYDDSLSYGYLIRMTIGFDLLITT